MLAQVRCFSRRLIASPLGPERKSNSEKRGFPLISWAFPRVSQNLRLGLLAMPSRIAQAAAPLIGPALLVAYGANGTLAAVLIVAVVNFMLAVMMFASLKRSGIYAQG
jgi:hypothetical protein